jgi:adenylate cyclase
MNNKTIYKGVHWAIFISFVSGLLSLQAYGQSGYFKIDSFKQIITNSKSDTDKINNLISCSKNIPCEDTINKLLYGYEALKLAKDIQWEKGLLNANIALCEIYDFCIKRYSTAVNYYIKAIAIAKNTDDKLKQAHLLSGIANVYKKSDQYSKALDYYREVLALKTYSDCDLGALANMGIIYTNLADYPHALACYDSSLNRLEASIRTSKKSEYTDTLQMAGLLINIGEIYIDMDEYDKALGNYNSALILCEQTQNKLGAIYALTGIGRIYRHQDNFAKAIEYYNKALEASKEVSNKVEETGILDQLGNIYLDKGEVDKAMEYAQSALKLAEANDYNDWRPSTYITLGKIYTRLKDYKKAVGYLEKTVALCRNTGELDREQEALAALSHAYELMGQPALAFNAYRQYMTIRDSIYNISKANALTRIDLQYSYEKKQVADSLKQATDYQLKMQRQQVYTWSGYAGLAMVILLSFFIYRNYSQQKKANQAISIASEAVKKEKQVSEDLLLNILPEEVARELKTKGMVDARLFDHVTVLFTDFINFTEAAERFTPQELVAELHTCFMAFDNIISKYNIEKIKTVGDGYVAASGLPQANAAHSSEMVKAAIEIRNFMEARKRELGNRTFGIRIGINSGTVVAGIVGVKKFAYDIWGDTVNIAARMEQYGQEGKINISQTTYNLVKNDFTCTDRGELDAKHKGKMRMYFVEV